MSTSSKFHLELLEPQIIKVCMTDGIDIELKDAQEMIHAASQLANGKTYVTLFDASKTGTISKEARDAFAVSPKRIAAAILTDSLANKLVGNFFIKSHKPLYPTRIFSNEKEALKWLRTQIASSR